MKHAFLIIAHNEYPVLEALELILSQNIIKLQTTDNQV